MMLKRGLALCFVLAFSAATYGQAEVINVSFSPNINGGSFAPGANVNVDVLLSQSGTGSAIDKYLRYVQFDLNAAVNGWVGSDGDVSLPLTHSAAGIDGWNFTTPTTSVCLTAANAACGAGHYLEDIFPGGPRPKVLAAAFTGLTAATGSQIKLPASPGTVTVLKLVITMPLTPGPYVLNLVNASDTNPDRGAEVRWGFGSGAPDPLVKKRAQDGGITGGVAAFIVGDCTADFVSSVPGRVQFGQAYQPGSSLWRAGRNTIRMTFDDTIAVPAAEAILIQELLPDGAFGPNLNTGSNFTFTVEPGNVLRVREGTTPVLLNRKWYAIRNTGAWTGVCNFEAQYWLNVGDQNANGFTQNNDVITINNSPIGPIPGSPNDQGRNDTNGDGFRNNTDVILANNNGNSPLAAKPTGH